MRNLVLGLAVTLGLSLTGSPTAYAGGRLTRPTDQLRAATTCQPKATLRSARGVVLLVHGTGEQAEESWSWSYEPALHADGFATCRVQLPDHGLGDFDVAAEYVVVGIRKAARLTGHPISVLGHSQGGALPVWAVKFWPGLDRHVRDIVSLAGPFGGTQLADELCTGGQCAPLAWELRQGADHIAALRHAPLPNGVDVTSLSSQYDEIVRPQPQASQLDGATNILLQDVCAADPSEHGVILGDPVAYALALDALTHRGTARPARLPADTCMQTFIPHGDPVGSAAFLQGVTRFFTGLGDPRRWVDAEPPVPDYAAGWVRQGN